RGAHRRAPRRGAPRLPPGAAPPGRAAGAPGPLPPRRRSRAVKLTVEGGRALAGEASVPGDKSIGHRAVILAALSDGRGAVRGLSGGEDNLRTVAIFRALGVRLDALDGMLSVEGVGLDGLRAADRPLDCGNSGTTMRLLAGVLAAQPFPSVLVGDRYLESRPMARIAGPLAAMGARVEGRRRRPPYGDLCAPLTVG